jgi:hypothetical protein
MTPSPHHVVRGTLRRRLLVNAVVDPDEVAVRLPEGVRPHVTALGTVVGCCLLEIGDLRPGRLPAVAGITLRAAAHRMSVEWEDGTGEPVVGVYVPDRRTDSRLAVALGGRWFPGVHGRGRIDISDTPSGFSWRIQDRDHFGIDVGVTLPPVAATLAPGEPIGDTCIAATIGLSLDHHGALEAARMEPEHRQAREVVVDHLHSAFLSGFRSAAAAPAYLVENVRVEWTPADAPRGAARTPAR